MTDPSGRNDTLLPMPILEPGIAFDPTTMLVSDIVCAFVGNNSLAARDLPDLIIRVHGAVSRLSHGGGRPTPEPEVEKPTPAQIRASIKPNGLTSFVDGKVYQTLRRHLRGHGLTPETYRQRYGLPVDYPSVAPAYSAKRSAMAKQIGLGQLRVVGGDAA